MSPRRNRPKPRGRRAAGPPEEDDRPLSPEVLVVAPPGWQARAITAERASKHYRCPGCDHEIAPGTAHVVAWRAGEESLRRHWHKGCWDRERKRLGGR